MSSVIIEFNPAARRLQEVASGVAGNLYRAAISATLPVSISSSRRLPMTVAEQAAPLVRAPELPSRHGFDVECEVPPPGLDADTVRAISRHKREPEFLLTWRLAAVGRRSAWRGLGN